ncbi:hypothetical protein KR018_011964, partial [Drosophila ironensis]
MWRLLPRQQSRNFFLDNGFAYTEDRVLVRRVTFSCKHFVPERDLYNHFEGYGYVEEFTSHVPDRRLGAVLYADAKAAADALFFQLHFVHGVRLYLMAGATEDQPEERVDDGRGESAYDLNINDDVLRLMVRRFLPMDSRIIFASTCRRFRDIYALEAGRLTKNLHLDDICELTEWGIRQMIRMSGSQIESLEGGPLPRHWPHFYFLIRMLAPLGSQLKSVRFTSIRLCSTHIFTLFRSPQGLRYVTDLQLRRCGLRDQDLTALQQLHLLVSLGLCENSALVGETLNELPNGIERLDVSRCESLNPGNLSLLGALEYLKELRCTDIKTRGFNPEWDMGDQFPGPHEHETYYLLGHECPNLELLEMTVCPYLDEENVVRLPSLRTLILTALPLEPSPYSVNKDMLSALADKNKLESLDILKGASDFVTIQHLRFIICIDSLTRLVIRNQELSNERFKMLGCLPGLTYLDLGGSPQLSNTGVVFLVGQLRQLEYFNVEQCLELRDPVIQDVARKLRTRF